MNCDGGVYPMHVIVGPGKYVNFISEELGKSILLAFGQLGSHVGAFFRP